MFSPTLKGRLASIRLAVRSRTFAATLATPASTITHLRGSGTEFAACSAQLALSCVLLRCVSFGLFLAFTLAWLLCLTCHALPSVFFTRLTSFFMFVSTLEEGTTPLKCAIRVYHCTIMPRHLWHPRKKRRPAVKRRHHLMKHVLRQIQRCCANSKSVLKRQKRQYWPSSALRSHYLLTLPALRRTQSLWSSIYL